MLVTLDTVILDEPLETLRDNNMERITLHIQVLRRKVTFSYKVSLSHIAKVYISWGGKGVLSSKVFL